MSNLVFELQEDGDFTIVDKTPIVDLTIPDEEIISILSEPDGDVMRALEGNVYFLTRLCPLDGILINHPREEMFGNSDFWMVFDNFVGEYRQINKKDIPTTYSLRKMPESEEEELRIVNEIMHFPKHRVIWYFDGMFKGDILYAMAPQNRWNYGRYTFHRMGDMDFEPIKVIIQEPIIITMDNERNIRFNA